MVEHLTPLKAIREKCKNCMCDNVKEIRECPITDCSLYQYRFGKNPNRKGIGGNPDIASMAKKANSASN